MSAQNEFRGFPKPLDEKLNSIVLSPSVQPPRKEVVAGMFIAPAIISHQIVVHDGERLILADPVLGEMGEIVLEGDAELVVL